MKEYKCAQCGKIFTNKKKRTFCSVECYLKYIRENKKAFYRPQKKRVEVKCAECGKIEYVTPSRSKRYVCCSIECLKSYNSKRYNQKVKKICPICGKEFEVKRSGIIHHKTCGSIKCQKEWRQKITTGANNPNYRRVEDAVRAQSTTELRVGGIWKNNILYRHVVKEALGLNSTTSLPKGYVIHHKDADHFNNDIHNLIVLPKITHRLVHTWFGNILLKGLHSGIIDRETFFNLCNEEQKELYENIIDLDVTHQVVLKQGELPERPEMENRHPSIYRNIYEGSTTNERVLACNDEDSNFDTSALLVEKQDEIV